MSILHSKQTEALIKRIIGSSTEDEPCFASFINHYYYGVPYEDLSKRDLFDLKGAALAHLNLAKKRKGKQANIRIYSPDVERDGWRSDHAVLEIVTVDRPFLVDSVSMVLSQMGLRKHFSVHPVFFAKRDRTGELKNVASPLEASSLKGVFESYLHFEFDKPSSEKDFDKLRSLLLTTIKNIELAVMDWPNMRDRTTETAEKFRRENNRERNPDTQEYADFSDWMVDGNFTFLGYCELPFDSNGTASLDKASCLGLLKTVDDVNVSLPISEMSADEFGQSLLITKTNSEAPIHRASYMDLVAFPDFSEDGKCKGIRVVVGLFSSSVYNGSVGLIPVLRNKMKYVLRRSRFSSTTHSIRVLTNIMENYPRDMMFQVSEEALFEDVADTLELQEHSRVKVLLRREQFGRFLFSCCLYSA